MLRIVCFERATCGEAIFSKRCFAHSRVLDSGCRDGDHSTVPPRSHSDTRTLTHTHMHTRAHAAHSHTCGPGGLEARLASLPHWIPSVYSSSLGRRICRQAFWEVALNKLPNQGDPLLPASYPVLPSGTETGQKGPQRGLLLPPSVSLPPSLPSLPSPHPGVRGPRASPRVRGGRRRCQETGWTLPSPRPCRGALGCSPPVVGCRGGSAGEAGSG